MALIKNYHAFDLTERYDEYLLELIEGLRPGRVCDIGGGRNPRLSRDSVESFKIDYTLLDISQEELDRAPDQYNKVCVDIGDKEFDIDQKYDLVFSRMVAEHIASGEQFHKNIFEMLAPGGIAVHFFPTLYALPFTVNRIIPEGLSDQLLHVFGSRDRDKSGKFPAHYSWTYGPTSKQLSNLEAIGYEIPLYAAAFGHGYYKKIPIVRSIAKAFTKFLIEHPNYHLCSYSLVVLRRPLGQNQGDAQDRIASEIPLP